MDGDFDVVSWKGGTALLNQRILKINHENTTQLYEDVTDLIESL